jgi:hypothetical protein
LQSITKAAAVHTQSLPDSKPRLLDSRAERHRIQNQTLRIIKNSLFVVHRSVNTLDRRVFGRQFSVAGFQFSVFGCSSPWISVRS